MSSDQGPELDYAQEIAGCKALLLEMTRRAIHDWGLYKNSRRLKHRKLAQDAYVWLFVEGPGHPDWVAREKTGTQLTSFLVACELLELDPEIVRKRAREITVQEILSVGRPPTYRKLQNDDEDDADGEDTLDLGGLKRQIDEIMGPVDDQRWVGRWGGGADNE